MKEGWEYKKLGEVCNIDFGTRVVRSRDAGSIYPVYGGGGATFKMDTYNREDCMVISRFGMSEQCTRFVKGRFFLNDSGLTLSMKKHCMIQNYMDWQILYLNNTIYSLGRGAAQKNLDTKALAEIVIAYPNNLFEQQSIVDYLDSSFAKIDVIRSNAEKALNEAKAFFQASLKEMLEPKEGWEEQKFGKVCWYNKNNGLHKGTKYIGMEHIEQGTGNLLGTISSDDVLSNTFAFNKGDVLYGRLRPYLKKVIVADFDGCCSTEIFPIQSQNIIASFLMYWFLTDKITNKVNATCAGCRMPRGNMNEVLKFDISYPSIAEQHDIVTTLDSLKSKVDRLQANYDKISLECDALKQAILRKVFEG